jgi:hypothetical protein
VTVKFISQPQDVPVVKEPFNQIQHKGEYVDHLASPQNPVKASGVKAVTSVEVPGKLPVTKQESMYSEPIPLGLLHNVNVSGGQTVNLGNYESAKIQVSLTVPCTKETLDDAYEFASSWVSERLEVVMKQVKKNGGP